MAKTHNIKGAKFENPTYRVKALTVDYEEEFTKVDLVIEDSEDSISIEFKVLWSEIKKPSTTQENAVNNWVNTKLTEFII